MKRIELCIVSLGLPKAVHNMRCDLSVSCKIHTDIKSQSYGARLSYFHMIFMVAYDDQVQVGSLVSIQTQTMSWLGNSDVTVACFQVWEKMNVTNNNNPPHKQPSLYFFNPWVISKAPNQQHLLYLCTLCLHFALTGTFCGRRKRLQAPISYGLFPFTTVVIFMRPYLMSF